MKSKHWLVFAFVGLWFATIVGLASSQGVSPPGGGGTPSGAAGGSLGGTYPNPTVVTNANLTGGVTSVGNAATVVTNANLTGNVTSVGNATTLAAGSASVLNSGTLAAARGGAGTITGALKGDGAGVVSQAACADLSNGTTNCSAAVGQLPGTATNDNAAAGKVGEFLSNFVAVGSPVSLVSGAGKSIGTGGITLTAGDWDVYCTVGYQFGATTNWTRLIASVSATDNAIETTNPFDFTEIDAPTPSGTVSGTGLNIVETVGPKRYTITTNTTVFCVGLSTFTVSTAAAWGGPRARRAR